MAKVTLKEGSTSLQNTTAFSLILKLSAIFSEVTKGQQVTQNYCTEVLLL